MWVDCAHVPAVLLGGRLYMGNKGMMTVEASVVVPIILIIVVTEFFFGLFLIDMSVVKSETMRLADEAADVWKTDGKLADGTYKSQQLLLRNKNFLQKNRRGQLISKTRLRLQKRIATRLNIALLDSYKVSISGDKVLVQASVRLGNPLLGGRKYTGIKGWEFSLEGYYKDMHNVLEYQDGASFFGTSGGWQEKVEMGRGRSFGLEILVI